MAIQKRFIHFKKFSDFNSKKLSANEANTQYTIGVSGAIQSGAPDILYQSYCWIKDTQQQWTHGQLYNGKEASGGEKNVQSDWNVTDTSSDAYIKNKPNIPAAVTESTVSGWGFTKNTGTYSKPSGGIPKTDLASTVQTSLGKADTALQSYTEQYKGTITGVSANGTSVATSGVANIPAASTSAYGVTKLSSATNSTSTSLAATASAVKAVYDLANGKQDKLVSGTNIKTINGESILGTGDIPIKERELEKYATDKSWSIVASNLLELSGEFGNAPDGTKAIVVASANSLYGVNLFDAFMGNVDGIVDVLTNPNTFTLEISAIDTSVELPVSIASDVKVEIPFNYNIYIEMGSDLASVYRIFVQKGYSELVWSDGQWAGASYMIGNKIPLSRLSNLDDNAFAGLMAIAPALIVDFVATKAITEYVKNGDNWEVWSEGESGLNTKLNAWLEQIAQLLPTKTSQLENDSNFVTSGNLKTINGESILGSGDITISGGGASGGSGAYSEVNHGTSDTTFTLSPNTFHVWDEISTLDVNLGAETSGVANEYLFQFTSGSEPTSLILSDDIKWVNDSAPTIQPNKIYQISILKGLGSVLEFNNASLFPITITVGASGYYEVYSYFMTNYSLPNSNKPSNAITISEQIIIEDSNDSVSGAVIKASIGLSNRLFLFTEKSINNYSAVYINESGYCDTYFYD